MQKLVQPDGAKARLPGRHAQQPRGHLNAIDIFQEIHCDGHEKLNERALQIGHGIGLDIYGMRDHTGYIYQMDVVPNAQNKDTVGHLFLDLAQDHQGMFHYSYELLSPIYQAFQFKSL